MAVHAEIQSTAFRMNEDRLNTSNSKGRIVQYEQPIFLRRIEVHSENQG